MRQRAQIYNKRKSRTSHPCNSTKEIMNWRDLTIKYVKDLLRAKTPLEMAQKELNEAQLAKLQAETSVEYSQAIVNYNEQRIFRLMKRINELEHYE